MSAEAGARLRVYSTEAVVLRRMDFGEADRIVTVLTPYAGKLRLLAKGVRRPRSRMAGHLEPFVHAHIQCARGRELDVLTQATTIEAFRAVREDLLRAAHAFHLVELVDGLLPQGEEPRGIFGLLREALAKLSRADGVPSLLARQFEIHLLAAVGYRPELGVCVSCREEIWPIVNGYSAYLGGCLCPACLPGEPGAVAIQPDSLKLLRHLQRCPFGQGLEFRVPDQVLVEAERVLCQHLEFVLERRLRATEFVRQVAKAIRAKDS